MEIPENPITISYQMALAFNKRDTLSVVKEYGMPTATSSYMHQRDEIVTDRIIKKVGLPESVADQVKGALPGIMNTVTSKLSAEGKNDEGGIAGMLGNLTDMFDGDDNNAKDGNKSSGGIGGLIGKFFGK